MSHKVILAGVGIAAIACGAASAAARVHPGARARTHENDAIPAHPIPYAQVDAYLRVWPTQHAHHGRVGGKTSGGPAARAG